MVDRCIIVGAGDGGAVYLDNAGLSFLCTDIWGNTGGDWYGPISNQLGENGNVCVDPQFCDPANLDFGLAATSPCAPDHSGCGQIGAWPVACDSPLAIGPQGPKLAMVAELAPPYPNPFNPMTTLVYTLADACHVRLTIHALDGRRLSTLVDGVAAGGRHVVTWTGHDASGRALPSGTYLAVMEAAGERHGQRLVLVR